MKPRQEKRKSYTLYQPRMKMLVKEFLNSLKKQEFVIYKDMRKKNDYQIFSEMANIKPELMFSFDSVLMTDDYHWEKLGRPVIYPESTELLDRLLKSHYHVEQLDYLKMPFKAFVVAIPSGYTFQGVPIHSFLVSNYEADTIQDRYDEFSSALFHQKIPLTLTHSMSSGEWLLNIACLDANGTALMRSSEGMSRMGKLMQCKDYQEFSATLGRAAERVNYTVKDLEDEDAQIQFYVNRLAMAMAIYHNATNGEYLTKGFPTTEPVKIQGPFVEPSKIKHYALKDRMVIDKREVNSHVRSWHFRQLRHEKYYTGEFETLPKGSRWVFVSESWVNSRKIDANTLHNQKNT